MRAQSLALCPSLWTVARQDPLSTGFFRQEYKRGLPFPPSGAFLNPEIKLTFHVSPTWQMDFLSTEP